jgi:hypothetical protein
MATKSWKSTLFRSKLFWAMVSVPLIGLIAIVCIWFVRQSSLDAQLAELRAKGLPTTASEVNDFYVVPAGVTDTTDLWVAAIDAVQAADLSTRGKTLPFIGEGPTPVPPPGEAWAELEASRALITGLDSELQMIWQAAAAGGLARYPVDFSAGINTPLPYTQNSRDVAKLLSLDAHTAAHDGDNARALQDLKAIFSLSDALRREPCPVSQLTRIALHEIGNNAVEQLLPHCQWDDVELQTLQSAIRSAQFNAELINGLHGERVVCLDAFDTISLGPFRPANKLETLRHFKRLIDGLSGSWPEAIERQNEIRREIHSIGRGKLSRIRLAGVSALLPAICMTVVSSAQADARQKTTIAAIAVQRHRLKHGQWPKSLAEISSGLFGSPAAQPGHLADPFDVQPLRYKLEETRVVIYSVGRDEFDDGGDVDGTSQQPPQDIGFTLKR